MIKNTSCNENETEGMVFAKYANDPGLSKPNELLEDDAQYYADCTDRSSKLQA